MHSSANIYRTSNITPKAGMWEALSGRKKKYSLEQFLLEGILFKVKFNYVPDTKFDNAAEWPTPGAKMVLKSVKS